MIAQEPRKIKKFKFFVGIDISRNELDFAILEGSEFLFHREIKNESVEIVPFIQELKSMPRFAITKALFCMESSGIYGNHLLDYLKALKAWVIVENPLRIKSSLGFNRGKSDKIDAIRIAKYAARFSKDLNLWMPKRTIIQKLAMLMTLRTRMINVKNIVQTPLKEQINFIHPNLADLSDALCSRSLTSLRLDVAEIDATIDLIIERDGQLRHLMEIITSVPGVGRITAIMIIVSTNEFKTINEAKKFACYAGVAPFTRESGIVKGKGKISKIANKKVKALLHSCAMSAIRADPELKEYYHRRTKMDGKAKMSSINAVRNKLVLRIFACVNQDRCYDANYTSVIAV